MSLPYDETDKASIVNYAKKLVGKSLRGMCHSSLPTMPGKSKSKGRFGQLLEEFYFLYKPNSNPECDFPKANLELKSTPLKQLKSGVFVAKERLVLNIIDYNEIIKQSFRSSSLFMKNGSLLLVCYLYENGVDIIDYIVHLVDEWTFPEDDLIIIQRDWETIKTKVEDGKAHEISESDTYYLAACTKGTTSVSSLRTQPNSSEMAKQRAYSLKQSYLNYVILSIAGGAKNYGKLLKAPDVAKALTIEEYALSLFNPYIGLNDSEIFRKLKTKPISKSKDYFARVSKLIMAINPSFEIEEFAKAGIEIKTIRVENNDKIKQHISFPAFKYDDILEEEWETSKFYEQASCKYLFVFFKKTEKSNFVLSKVVFWSMPQDDILKIKNIWEHTKSCISQGKIVKEIKNGRRITYFTKAKDNTVGHIRPHATTTNDTYHLPVSDILTNVNEYTKHCLWINNKYVLNNIYNK